MENNEVISVINIVKNYLETCIIENQNNDFKEIYEKVCKYLNTHCNHLFVDDYIDITPEISKKITYCSLCFLSKK